MAEHHSPVAGTDPNMGRQGTIYSNSSGEQMPYDGVSPVAWRVASYALAIRDGKILAIVPPWIERWEQPGGVVENDERVLDAAIRECWEETGYRFVPASTDPICIREWNYLSPRDKSFQHSLMLMFHGTVEGEQDPNWQLDQEEVRTIAWIDPATLTREGTHGLLWTSLLKLGLIEAPAEA